MRPLLCAGNCWNAKYFDSITEVLCWPAGPVAAFPSAHPLLGDSFCLLRGTTKKQAVCRLPISRGGLQTRAVAAEQAPPKASAPAAGEKVKIGINGAESGGLLPS